MVVDDPGDTEPDVGDALIVKSEFENAHLLETVRRFVEIRT